MDKKLQWHKFIPTSPERKQAIIDMIKKWFKQIEIEKTLKVSPKVIVAVRKELKEWLNQDNYLLDIDKKNAKNELNSLKKKYEQVLKELEINKERGKYIDVASWNNDKIKIDKPKGNWKSESTAVLVASDWHLEESIDADQINWLNEFNLDIAEERAKTFFANGLKMVDMLAPEEKINNVVLALLGDFISGYIHSELKENNNLSPTQAILMFKKLVTSGIDYFLNNSSYDMTIVTAFWNHWRTTEKKQISTGWKNSFERMMYNILADEYKEEDRIKFKVEKGYHNYLQIYDKLLRFHHWDWMKYQGWVWWITIPVNKAIAQRNKAKTADLDVFWHRHSLKDWGNFVCNGSLIWYWPYSEAIKADFEEPKQAFFLINSKFWKTITAPIFLNNK